MIDQIKISRNIESEISEPTVESIKSHIYKNIETKIDTYMKSIWAHKYDAEIKMEVKVEKIYTNKFEIKIHLVIDGRSYNFKRSSEWNEDIYMLIDNLFKTIKAELSDDHKKLN